MKKEELRPVEIFHEPHMGNPEGKRQKGYFHSWFKKVGESGTEYMWCIVELEDGRVVEDGADCIKFMDR